MYDGIFLLLYLLYFSINIFLVCLGGFFFSGKILVCLGGFFFSDNVLFLFILFLHHNGNSFVSNFIPNSSYIVKLLRSKSGFSMHQIGIVVYL